MITKKLLIATATLTVFACLVLVTLAMLPPRPGVTFANFGRIEEGMPQLAVEDLLGPPSDLSPSGICWGDLHHGKLAPGHQRVVWGGDDGAIVIVFDEHGKMVFKNWSDLPRTFFDKVRTWLQIR